ncbi:zinc finger protein 501-like [Achroia grisella]|uniref:zinc finger protein 501-like n=1 Tax=Achroia grisella TaxID=688607 RepID=UPI0027D2EECA|nr:zinc finger protein 501-like [Achroia grisella]
MTDVNNIEILEKMNTCLTINILKNDHLPMQLCQMCLNKLEDIYIFRKMVSENQNLLINYLKTGTDELNKFYLKLKNGIDVKDSGNMNYNENKLLNVSKLTSNTNDIPNNNIKHEIIDNFDSSINYSSEDEISLSSLKKAKEENYNAKMEINKSNLNENFKCLMCMELVDSRGSLLWHYNKVHASKEGSTISDVDYSILSSNGINVYKCNKCNKKYSNNKSINRHVVGHTESRPFICKICGRTYKTASDIVRHGRVHNGYKFYCAHQCGYSTVYIGALKDHQRRHRLEHKYKCEKCGKGFQVRTWYEQHQNIHNGLKPYVCHLCGVAFHMDRYLTAHRTAVHPQSSKLKRYMCVHCYLPCDSMKALTEHLKEHGIKSSFLCDVCGKTLTNAEQLKFHKRTHLGEKPYKCSTCNKSFAKKFNLQLHQRTHTGERAYACARCDKRFTQRSTLLRHNARQHAGLEILKCKNC